MITTALSKPVQILAADHRREPSSSLEDVIAAFHRARSEVANLLSQSGLDATKTRESARELGLNRGLTWRITRMVRESDPTLVASEVPGAASMARFFDACRQRGAPEQSISAAMAALQDFETAVSECSGDRKTLAMLLANRTEARGASEAEKARRKMFEGGGAVWGVQAQVRFVTVFAFPSPDDPTMIDAGHVTGFVGFRRLSSRPWPMTYEAVFSNQGEIRQFVKEPLDPEGFTEGQLQLLKRFCSPRNPEIQIVQSGGFKRFELAAGPVGNEGLTTCVFGTRLRAWQERYSPTGARSGFMVIINTPVERVIFDMFLHRDLNVSSPPMTQLLDRLTYPHGHIESEFDRQSLPLSESPVMLPPGVHGTLCPHIPWYTSLIEDVTQRIGQPIENFVGSRFEMTYPPLSTMLRRSFPLMPPPGA